MTAPGDAEAVIGGRHARRLNLPTQHARPVIEGVCAETDTAPTTCQHCWRLRRNAYMPEAELTADPQHQLRHRRMQVHMLMRIRVMQCQSSRREGCELRTDFR